MSSARERESDTKSWWSMMIIGGHNLRLEWEVIHTTVYILDFKLNHIKLAEFWKDKGFVLPFFFSAQQYFKLFMNIQTLSSLNWPQSHWVRSEMLKSRCVWLGIKIHFNTTLAFANKAGKHLPTILMLSRLLIWGLLRLIYWWSSVSYVPRENLKLKELS